MVTTDGKSFSTVLTFDIARLVSTSLFFTGFDRPLPSLDLIVLEEQKQLASMLFAPHAESARSDQDRQRDRSGHGRPTGANLASTNSEQVRDTNSNYVAGSLSNHERNGHHDRSVDHHQWRD